LLDHPDYCTGRAWIAGVLTPQPRGPHIHLKICPSMMPTVAMPETMPSDSQSGAATWSLLDMQAV
jgi:hypothetical protein